MFQFCGEVDIGPGLQRLFGKFRTAAPTEGNPFDGLRQGTGQGDGRQLEPAGEESEKSCGGHCLREIADLAESSTRFADRNKRDGIL